MSPEEEKKAESSDDEDGGNNLKEVSFSILLIYEIKRAVASRSRQSETELRVANYSRIGTYRRSTSGKDFPCELSHRTVTMCRR